MSRAFCLHHPVAINFLFSAKITIFGKNYLTMKHLFSFIIALCAVTSWAAPVTIKGKIDGNSQHLHIMVGTQGNNFEAVAINTATNTFSHTIDINTPDAAYMHISSKFLPGKDLSLPVFIPAKASDITVDIKASNAISATCSDPNSQAIASYINDYLPRLFSSRKPLQYILPAITSGADSISMTMKNRDAIDYLQYYAHLNRAMTTSKFRYSQIRIPTEALVGCMSAQDLVMMPGLKYFREASAPLVIQEIAIGSNLESRLNRVKAAVADTALVAIIEQQLTEQERIDNYSRVGGEMPDVPIIDPQGNEHRLAEFKGRYVYIDMWASWCGPCNQEIPYLKELEKTLGNDQVVFVSISIDEDPDAWKAAIKRHNLTGNQFLGNETLATLLKVQGIPRFLIYDKEGRLLYPEAPRPSSGMTIRRILNSLK